MFSKLCLVHVQQYRVPNLNVHLQGSVGLSSQHSSTRTSRVNYFKLEIEKEILD